MAMKEPTDRILNSLEGIERARPGDAVFEQIQARLEQRTGKTIPLHQIRLAAACLLVLVILNVICIGRSLQQNQQASTEKGGNAYELVSDYQLYEN